MSSVITSFQKCVKVFAELRNISLDVVSSTYRDVVVEDDRTSMVLDDRMDLITKLTGSDNITATYFEGLNVLIRIPGTTGISGAILLSAHFDSVSTAPGATVCLLCHIAN